ncbi:hypothetical protein HYQ46_000027 [Verticillium longisporum]|nr:hypothetical protein HYQ46_000027 [Verticillium longisporum]
MIVHPGQPLLNGLDLETDRAEDDVLDGLDEDCAVENCLEASRHAICERVERVIDRARGLPHPAEKIVVDLILGREHHAVGAVSPLLGYRSQAADNVLGEFADLVGQLRYVVRVIADNLGVLLLATPSLDLKPGHWHDAQDGKHRDDNDENGARCTYEVA